MNWIVKRLFAKYYGSFIYPFDNADSYINTLSPEDREAYLFAVKRWKNSLAYKIENQEVVRKFYQELATKSQSKTQAMGYRLTLIFIQNLHNRYDELAKRHDLEAKSKKVSKH